MSILIKNVLVSDYRSAFHEQKIHLRIQEGSIAQIQAADELPSLLHKETVMEAEGLYLSPGWIDMRVLVPEPGHEHRETLHSARLAAQKGGFTQVALLPNTVPVIQRKNEVAFLKALNAEALVHFYPMAALTRHTKGEDFTEMIDLHQAGVVAFTDGIHPLNDPDLLRKCLLYLQYFDGLLINRPEETQLTRFGQMNEGRQSTLLGLTGMPALAEDLMVMRDLEILRYTGGKLHLGLVSTQKSVGLIRAAKAEGLKVSCDVAVHQLYFLDEDLANFDTHLKVNPPFRGRQDQEALWQGLADGTIDAIVSDHSPQDIEQKHLEFDLAAFGIIGLETLFSVLWEANQRRGEAQLPLPLLLEKISHRPRELLGLPPAQISEGVPANLTLFSLHSPWTPSAQTLASLSQNSPFLGHTFEAQPKMVFHHHFFYQNA
ncbi:MAG: dihydroorotase [Microscillaceae bacterium]|nr:dihydroorotase [Microscillaceae bacterium]